MIFQLIYTSSVGAEPFVADVFAQIPSYQARNSRLGVTGLLLVKQGAFLQILEGEEAAVRSLYQTIREDPRHHHVHTLAALHVSARQFPDWSMGFADLDGNEVGLALGEASFQALPTHTEAATWQASVAMGMVATFIREV